MPSLMLPQTLKPRPVKSRLRRLTRLTLVALGYRKKTGVDCYTGDENSTTLTAGVALLRVDRDRHICMYMCVRVRTRYDGFVESAIPERDSTERRSMNGSLADDKLITQGQVDEGEIRHILTKEKSFIDDVITSGCVTHVY